MALENEQKKKSKSLSVPTDIIVDLLLKLPVETLLRFKSVCKLWNSLISDPHFVKSHLSLSHHRRLILNFYIKVIKSCSLYDMMYDKSFNVLELDYPLKECSKSVSIVGSCNGLLCIVLRNVNDNLTPKRKIKIKRRNERDIDTLLIWNPSTRKSSTRLPYWCDSEVMYSQYSDWYGFGYDESSDDYKVVKVHDSYSINGSRYKVLIYSLKTGRWKHFGDFPHGTPQVYSCTFLNGAFHWFAKLNNTYSPYRIISLDLEKETYGEVLQPEYDGEALTVFGLGVLGESLCVVRNFKNYADVWVMKVYGVKDSWVKLFSFTYPTDGCNAISVPFFISYDDGKVLLKLNSNLGIYDYKNTSYSEIMNNEGYQVDGYAIVESLVSPDDLN